MSLPSGDDLKYRELSGTTIRHRLAALSSLFEYLCNKNVVARNPVKGIEMPSAEGYEGKMSAIGDHHARGLLNTPIMYRSKANATVPFWPPCSITSCGVKSYASSWSRTSSTNVAESRILRFPAGEERHAIFRCIPLQADSSLIIWKRRVMVLIWVGCPSSLFATIAQAL